MRLIDADELKEAMNEHTDYKGYLVCDPEEIIDLAPTVERPHGEWSGEPERREMVTRVCTACGKRGAVGHFCMWCGAYDGDSPRRDEKYDPDVIKGKDEKGYFIMVRECIHTDGTPDEWAKTYYKPLPKEGEKLENDRRGIPGIPEEDEKAE